MRSAKSVGSTRRSCLARARARRTPRVVVLTRDEVLPHLRNVVVALVTRTIRGLKTEVQLGPADGLPVECVVSLDNLRTVPQALLTQSITRLDSEQMNAICRALTHATGC